MPHDRFTPPFVRPKFGKPAKPVEPNEIDHRAERGGGLTLVAIADALYESRFKRADGSILMIDEIEAVLLAKIAYERIRDTVPLRR